MARANSARHEEKERADFHPLLASSTTYSSPGKKLLSRVSLLKNFKGARERKEKGENSSSSVKKLRKRDISKMRPRPEPPLSLARGRALVGKSFFKLPGLFQRASLIIAARISFHKTSFAREISLRFFVPESRRSLTADFRKGAFNFHLRREIRKELLSGLDRALAHLRRTVAL